jgi:hypothetical protein
MALLGQIHTIFHTIWLFRLLDKVNRTLGGIRIKNGTPRIKQGVPK